MALQHLFNPVRKKSIPGDFNRVPYGPSVSLHEAVTGPTAEDVTHASLAAQCDENLAAVHRSLDVPPVLSRTEAARYLGLSPQTLAAWACNKRVALPYAKIGRRVVYRAQDLDAFVAANLTDFSEGRLQ